MRVLFRFSLYPNIVTKLISKIIGKEFYSYDSSTRSYWITRTAGTWPFPFRERKLFISSEKSVLSTLIFIKRYVYLQDWRQRVLIGWTAGGKEAIFDASFEK